MEQLNRTKRYLHRLRYAYEGIQAPSAIFDIEDPKDDCISFFMHCYHVKDWIKELYCESDAERKNVESYIDDHEELKICADLCNGSKHFRITRKEGPRSGSPQSVALERYDPSVYITGTGGVEVHKLSFQVESSTTSYDALELAEKCYELWRSYVSGVAA